MASNFNNDMNDPILPGARATESSAVSGAAPSAVADTPAVADSVALVQPAAVSAAVIKFRSCRWRRPPEDGTECCGHRDVLPMAGTNSFDAEAWCPDCTYFKLRRTPKKRDDSYRY